jgi:hypothetical protein
LNHFTVPVAIVALLACANLLAAARPSCDRSSEVSIAFGKAPRKVRDKQSQARISGLYAVPARGSTAPYDRRKGEFPRQWHE